jgi:hypothetical protein
MHKKKKRKKYMVLLWIQQRFITFRLRRDWAEKIDPILKVLKWGFCLLQAGDVLQKSLNAVGSFNEINEIFGKKTQYYYYFIKILLSTCYFFFFLVVLRVVLDLTIVRQVIYVLSQVPYFFRLFFE